MKIPSRPGSWPVHIHPGFLAMILAMSAACGYLLGTVRVQATGTFDVQWWEAVLAGVLALSAVGVHEFAHAVVGAATGRRIERIDFGLKIGVVSAGDSTALHRAASIAAGPLAEIAVGALLWSLAGGGVPALATPVGLAGAMAAFNGVANLVPFHPSMDGWKLFRFLTLAARGRTMLNCAPPGDPCPACTGIVGPAPQNEKTPPVRQGGVVVLPVVTR
ncbi:MAG TPA: peptidase M50 [Arthrobacter sp.]